MQQIQWAMVFLFLVSSTAWADQAVITYRSGKTQTIQLEESAENVQGIVYLKEVIPEALKSPPAPARKEQPAPAAAEEKKKGSGPRLKCGEPIIGD
ncbi:MAG: hypothetical protein HZC44_05150 [Geobacter sp.]|nr:hypothetical protein [Geobacter sp.]